MSALDELDASLDDLYDFKNELALVGSCILDPVRVIPQVQNMAGESDFHDKPAGALYGAILTLHGAGRPVDDGHVLLTDLRAMKDLPPEVATLAYLNAATNECIASHAAYYAHRTRTLSRLRAIHKLLKPLLEQITSRGADPDEILGWMEAQAARVRCTAATDAKPIHEIWKTYIDRLESDLHSERPRAMLSGFPAADRLGFVFVPGEMTIIAARPSVGKTAIASQIGMHHARLGRRVLMASLEMGGQELGARMIVAAAGRNHQLIRVGDYDQGTVNALRVEAENIGERPFHVFDPGRVKVGVIAAAASVFASGRGLDLVIVDYIGLVRPDDERKQRHEQVGDVAKGLRDIAVRLKVPVIALAQLNRQADGEIPTLSMLRESGDLEQDADQVAFLHPNPQEYAPNAVDLILAKNRQSARGTVPLDWNAVQTRFTDPSIGSEWNA